MFGGVAVAARASAAGAEGAAGATAAGGRAAAVVCSRRSRRAMRPAISARIAAISAVAAGCAAIPVETARDTATTTVARFRIDLAPVLNWCCGNGGHNARVALQQCYKTSAWDRRPEAPITV